MYAGFFMGMVTLGEFPSSYSNIFDTNGWFFPSSTAYLALADRGFIVSNIDDSEGSNHDNICLHVFVLQDSMRNKILICHNKGHSSILSFNPPPRGGNTAKDWERTPELRSPFRNCYYYHLYGYRQVLPLRQGDRTWA